MSFLFSLKKASKAGPKKANVLGEDTTKELKAAIDGFLKTGAVKNGEATEKPLVIKPKTVSTGLRAAARQSLLNDEPPGLDGPDIPVSEFGAAMLRGMGWDGKVTKPKTDVSKRRRGAVLGIGAQAIDESIEAELMSRKKLRAPLIKKTETTQ